MVPNPLIKRDAYRRRRPLCQTLSASQPVIARHVPTFTNGAENE